MRVVLLVLALLPCACAPTRIHVDQRGAKCSKAKVDARPAIDSKDGLIVVDEEEEE